MSNVAIVAIPSQDDFVWKLSSEKVPHMTILSLGDHVVGPDSARIESYLQHAIDTMLHRFGMSVDRRGPLGPDSADVLFFDKSFCSRQLLGFRDALLKDPTILDWYNGSPQFAEWTPHLTMGWPTSPAHEDTRDYPGLSWVNFDKIAFWVNDFSGPEFPLAGDENLWMSDPEMMNLDKTVALAAIAAQRGDELGDILHEKVLSGITLDQKVSDIDVEHFGRLGMKWGVVHPRGAGGLVTIPHESKEILNLKTKVNRKGTKGLTNEELKKLTDRLNLENNYSKAQEQAQNNSLAKVHAKVKRGLDLGQTVNKAIKFSNSEAGLLLAETITGKKRGKAVRFAGKKVHTRARPRKK